MKHLRKLKLQDNPGLKEDHSKDYLKLLQLIEGNNVITKQKAREYKNQMKDVLFIDNMHKSMRINIMKFQAKANNLFSYIRI